jgi:hypothetical protein
VQRFIDTARDVLTQPGPFFRTMRREGGLGAPLVFALIGIVLGSLGSMLARMVTPFGGFGPYGDYGGLGFSLFVLPVMSLVGLFIAAGILHVLLVLVASSKHSFETTFRLVAYTSGSTSPFNIVPFVGGLLGAVWALVVLIIGAAESHDVSQGQAAVAVLLPSVLCCGMAILFGGALLALLFGAAAAGMRP